MDVGYIGNNTRWTDETSTKICYEKYLKQQKKFCFTNTRQWNYPDTPQKAHHWPIARVLQLMQFILGIPMCEYSHGYTFAAATMGLTAINLA